MNTGLTDLCVGTGFALLSLFLLFVLTPLGVDIPTASVAETGSVTPRFFPDFISWLMLLFSLALMGTGWLNRKRGARQERGAGKDLFPYCIRCLAMLTLLGVYFTAHMLGMVLTSCVLYLLFSLYTGERRPLRALLGAALCSAVLYYFFVHIANVPMPLGIFFGSA